LNDLNYDGKHSYEQPEMRYRERLRKADMPTPKLTAEIINAAIVGFESQKRRIDDQIAELRSLLSGGSTQTAATPEAPTRKRKKFSAAARKRMKEAQQRRWAKIRGESEPQAPEPPKAKRKLSKAGRAAIVAALKKRWRETKAAAAKPKRTVAKKTAVKKAAVKAASAKAAKKSTPAKKATVKKAAAKKTAPAPVHPATEPAAQ
jgi:hypothetical protein